MFDQRKPEIINLLGFLYNGLELLNSKIAKTLLLRLKGGKLPRAIDVAIAVIALTMVAYHLASTQTILLSSWQHQNLHYFFALLLVYLGVLRAKPKLWPLILLLIGATIVCCGYVHIFSEDLAYRIGRPTTLDVIIGFLLFVIGFEACRRNFGLVLPIIALFFIAYAFLGHHIPGKLGHPEISYERIATHLSIGFHGIYGLALSVSADMIFYFMLFGGLLQATGATRFVMEIGKLVARKIRSGVAQTSVVSSALVGMVTGGPMANVGITGAFTIPAMKEAGYTPEQAGGIEAAASTGGQLMPPVMGVTAFILAEWIMVPYIKVCAMAIVPALLYFIGVGIYAHLNAMKLNIRSAPEPVDKRIILTRLPLFGVPLTILIILLMEGYSPRYSVFWTLICLIVLASFITRPSLSTWIQGFTKGAISGAGIGVACAVLGPVMSMVSLTGLEAKLPFMIQGLLVYLPVALILTGMVAIILGCGLHTLAVYIITALVLAPTLTNMGVGLEQAHFFLLFFGVSANITPPVALAALAASGLAGSGYIKTAFESFKAGIIVYILCFLIVYNPVFLGKFEYPLWGALSLIASVLGLLCITASFVGQYFTRLSSLERGISFMSGAAFFAFAIIENYYALAIGMVVLFIFTFTQLRKRRIIELAAEVSND